MAEQGRDREDRKLVREMMERVRTALLRQRRAGVLRSAEGPGQAVLWQIAG